MVAYVGEERRKRRETAHRKLDDSTRRQTTPIESAESTSTDFKFTYQSNSLLPILIPGVIPREVQVPISGIPGVHDLLGRAGGETGKKNGTNGTQRGRDLRN